MRKLFSSTFCKMKLFYVLFPAILFLFTGCSTIKITVSNTSSKPVEKTMLKKIAVIPFELILSDTKNAPVETLYIRRGEGRRAFRIRKKRRDSKMKAKAEKQRNTWDNAAKILTDLFVAELFNVPGVEIFTIDRIETALRNMALDPKEVFEKSSAQEVAKILGLDAFFSGKVFAYSYNKSANPINNNSNVSISVDLTSVKTGGMLWTGREAMRGRAVDVLTLGVWIIQAPSSYELASKSIKNVVASFKNSLD